MDVIITELHTENKATWEYFSSSKSEYSWEHCTDKRKESLMSRKAINDQAESTLGELPGRFSARGNLAFMAPEL